MKKPESNKIREYMLILYQGLKPNRFYWEFCNTLRKVLVLSTFVLSSNLRIMVSLSVLVTSGRLQIFLKPYKNEENNNCEMLAITAGTITTISGLVYSQDDNVEQLNYTFMVMILLFNAVFLLDWSYLMIKNYDHKLRFLKKVRLLMIISRFLTVSESF